jgi:hypothetical protein
LTITAVVQLEEESVSMVVRLRENKRGVIPARDLNDAVRPCGRGLRIRALHIDRLSRRHRHNAYSREVASDSSSDVDSHYIAVGPVRSLQLAAGLVSMEGMFDDVNVREERFFEVSSLTIEEAVVQTAGILAPELRGGREATSCPPSPVDLTRR